MSTFDFSFKVQASLAAVAEFHHDTRALSRLTPPPIFIQMQRVDPLGEGSLSEFTMWFGPLPVRWIARHSNVDRLRGFTDTQVVGPLKHWVHTHSFESLGPNLTQINEHIDYDHQRGWWGLFSRLFFAPIGLRFLFFYRAFITRRALETKTQSLASSKS